MTPPHSGGGGGGSGGGSGRTETPPRQSAVDDPLGSAGLSVDAEMSDGEESPVERSPPKAEKKSKGDDLELAYPKSKFNRNYLGAHGRRYQLPEIKGGFPRICIYQNR